MTLSKIRDHTDPIFPTKKQQMMADEVEQLFRLSDGSEAAVSPDWIAENGIPIDGESGEEGVYIGTRVGGNDANPDRIFDVWVNPDTKETVEVPPNSYTEGGMPIDPETGDDLVYSHTILGGFGPIVCPRCGEMGWWILPSGEKVEIIVNGEHRPGSAWRCDSCTATFAYSRFAPENT